jgi:uncharacterized Ntn-hydrolase superfamily protein
MHKGWIVLPALVAALAATDASAQFGARHSGAGKGRANGEQRAAVDQFALVLAELHEDLKLTAGQQAAWDGYARNVEALASDVVRERGKAKELSQMNALQRMDHAVDVARDRLTAMEDVVAAAKKLYAALSPEQQSVANPRLATVIAAAAEPGVPPAGGRQK